jgi:hypothetical protein
MGVYRATLPPGQEVLSMPVRVASTFAYARALQYLGRPVASPAVVQLILDTGTRRSCLTPTLINRIQCERCGRLRVQTTLAQETRELFEVRMEFPSSTLAPLPKVRVACLEMPDRFEAQFDGIIGRDLISCWEFFYSGFRRRITIRDRPSFWGWLYA